VALTLVLVPHFLNSSYLVDVLISCLLFGTLGATFDLSVGYMGLLNFGFAGFIGIGAYASALLAINLGVSPWLGLLIGGVASATVGLLVGALTLRLRGIFVAMVTWFVAEIVKSTMSNLEQFTGGYRGLVVPGFPSIEIGSLTINMSSITDIPEYYLILCLSISILIVLYLIVNSKLGLAFKAIREDEMASEVLGLHTTRYNVLNLTLSCFFAGTLGSFFVHYLGFLDPDLLGVATTIEVLTYTYVGGRATLWGSFLASFILIGFLELARPLLISRLIFYGALLILVMLLFPTGLAGIFKKRV